MAYTITMLETQSNTPNTPNNQGGDKRANYLTMIGHLCSDINQGALSALLPFLVVHAGYTYLQVTTLIFAANIVSAVIQPLFGWIGDRHPAPWFMALGVMLAGSGMAAIGYMPSYPLVVVCAALSGIGVAMFHPEGGRLANLAAGARKGNGMSIFAVGGNIGFFVGPILTAGFVGTWGLSATGVFLVPALGCAGVLMANNARFRALGVQKASAHETNECEHWGLFGVTMAVLSIRSILSYGLMAFIPLFLVDVLAQPESLSSLAISIFAIAAAVATAVSGRASERLGTFALLIGCSLLSLVAIAVFAMNTSVPLAVLLTVILAISIDLHYPAAVALGMSYVPRHLGMASGLTYGVAICVGGVVEPFLGAAGDSFGLIVVMVILVGLSVLSFLLSLSLKRIDSRVKS